MNLVLTLTTFRIAVISSKITKFKSVIIMLFKLYSLKLKNKPEITKANKS